MASGEGRSPNRTAANKGVRASGANDFVSGAQLLPNLGAGGTESKNFASSFMDFRGSNGG